ncbi:polysaccharide biosynthesis protein [Gramella sp. BOM4]|nr:polysaccharide biosynthesis protein [Christiangramia bathymodioli]
MKAYIEKLQSNPSYTKLLEWGRLLSVTSLAQIFVQVIGFLSGIIVIRFLSLEEYAFYTLANTILGTMTLLADGGVSAGVLSQSGKVWKEKSKLGKVLATGLSLRKKLAFFSLCISVPLLFFLLKHHGSSWLMATLIALALIPAFYADLSSALLVIVPKLHQDIPPILMNDIKVGLGRLFLTTFLIFIFPFTFIALLANGLPRLYGNIQLKKIAAPYFKPEKVDPKIEKKIWSTVKRMFPGVLYYCFSGQIMLWIISFFGNTTSLAQLGALARIAVILGLITKLSQTLVIPRFARLQEERKRLFKYYLQICFFLVLIIAAFISVGYLFAEEILWILGDKYSGLQFELLLVLLGGGINLLSAISFELNISRDWIINPLFSISLSIATMIIGAIFLDIAQLTGVLIFNILLAVVQFLINFVYGFTRMKKLPSISIN